MPANNFNIKGLTPEEVMEARKTYGYNRLEYKKENGFIDAVKRIVKDPMVILLLAASAIYFISGDIADGVFLSAAIVLVSTISLFQDSRSRNALEYINIQERKWVFRSIKKFGKRTNAYSVTGSYFYLFFYRRYWRWNFYAVCYYVSFSNFPVSKFKKQKCIREIKNLFPALL